MTTRREMFLSGIAGAIGALLGRSPVHAGSAGELVELETSFDIPAEGVFCPNCEPDRIGLTPRHDAGRRSCGDCAGGRGVPASGGVDEDGRR